MKTTDGQMIWQAGSYNQRGQLTAYSLGDNLNVTRVWDSYGFPREIVVDQVNPAENLTDQEYDFDPKTANLTIFRGKRHESLVEKYDYKKGKLYLVYFLTTIGVFILPIIIGKWIL